jgi:hypothetical protein
MAISKPTGPPPARKRRRENKPASYGLAAPVQAGKAAKQPPLGISDPHTMVERMWAALTLSAEGRFFSHADWERARWEMWYANQLFMGERQLTPTAWATVQNGLAELLISAADKRRAGIELSISDVDPDEAAAVVQLAKYKDALG